MTPTATPAALITQVELALLAGRNLEQIESEILESCEDDELQAVAWLYVWCCTDRASARDIRLQRSDEGRPVAPACVPTDRTAEHRAARILLRCVGR